MQYTMIYRSKGVSVTNTLNKPNNLEYQIIFENDGINGVIGFNSYVGIASINMLAVVS